MNILKMLFGGKKQLFNKLIVSKGLNQHNAHEQLLIEKVIYILKTKPECFSARWFDGKSLDTSIRSNDGQILIMIYSGQIIQPVRPIMSKEQRDVVKQLIEPIIKNDSDYLIEKLLCNHH